MTVDIQSLHASCQFPHIFCRDASYTRLPKVRFFIPCLARKSHEPKRSWDFRAIEPLRKRLAGVWTFSYDRGAVQQFSRCAAIHASTPGLTSVPPRKCPNSREPPPTAHFLVAMRNTLISGTDTSRSFATGPVDSPPRRINTRPVSKGLHYKGVLDDRVRASSTIGQQRGEASHGGHGGEKCSFGFLIMHLINVLVREAAPRQLHAQNASSFRSNSYSLPPWPPCDDFFEFLSQTLK